MLRMYEFEAGNIDFISHEYTKLLSEQVYSGDLIIKMSKNKEIITYNRGCCDLIPIFFYSCEVDTAYRRSYKYIRESPAQTCAVWVLNKGGIRVSTSNGSRFIDEGNILITDSSSPFLAEALTGRAMVNEHYLAVFPAHVFRARVPLLTSLNGLAFPASEGDGKAIAALIAVLFENSRLDQASTCELVQTTLRALGRLVTKKLEVAPCRHTLREARLESIMAMIDLEISNPELSLSTIARRCRISERYICRLMKEAGNTFGEVLRNKRLALARQWLEAPEKRNLSIREVAQLTGFRSNTQFSRAFKAFHSATPREIRVAGQRSLGL